MPWHNTTPAWVLICGAVLVTVAGCAGDPKEAARAALASGDEFVKKQQYNEASVEYRRSVQLDPTSGEARTKLADVFFRTNNAAAGLRELVRAADLLPGDADLQVKVGTIMLAAGRFEDARARADAALKARPQHVGAHVLRGNALAGLKDFDAGLAEMEHAIAAAPGSATTYTSLGALQYRRGDSEKAEEAFKKALELEPSSLNSRLTYAQFLMTTERRDEAEAQLKAAWTADQKSSLVNRILAVFYIAAGRSHEAEPHLAQLASDDDPQAQLSLAQLYLATRRVKEATTLLTALAAREATSESTSDAATLLLAQIAFGRNDRAHAYSIVQQLLEKRPDNVRALIARAGFLLADKKTTDAVEAATRATAADPSSADAFSTLAAARMALRQLDEAKLAYSEVLKLRPRDVRAQVALAELNLATGKVDEARQFAERATQNAPDALLSRAAVAKTSLAARDLARAESEIAKLMVDYPKAAIVHTLDGMLRLAQNDLAAAERAFSTAAQLGPASADAVAGLVSVDLAAGRTASARRRADEIASNPAVTTEGLLLAANTYARLNDAARVEQILRRAVDLDPARSEPYVMLGQLYVQQRRADQALREFQAVAERQPNSVGAHTLVGALLHQQNRRAEAKAAYRKTLSLDRTAPVAANNLAWMMMEDGENLDEALQLAQAAKSRLPNSSDVGDTLGWLYFKKGLPARALDELKPAVEKNPENAGYQYHLGLVYAEMGFFSLAEKALRTAVTLNPNAPEATEAHQVLARLGSN
jgi:tetratricopeptide (TPR) repeat protein